MSKLKIRENHNTDTVVLVNLIKEEIYCLGSLRIPNHKLLAFSQAAAHEQTMDKTEIRC